jgi:AraC-like DNA-binding protein
MQSRLSIQLISVLYKCFISGQFAHLTNIPLNWATAKLCTLSEGHTLVQSLSNYLVHLEFLEFNFIKEVIFKTMVHKPSFCMFVMFQGKSVFSDQLGNIVSETTGNSGTLSYLQAGTYNWQFLAGQHKIMCLTFREDYFIRKCESMPQFRSLIEASQSADIPYSVLPHCMVAKSMLHLVRKLLVKNSGQFQKDVALNSLIDEFLNKYNNSLAACQYDTHTLKQLKVAEITNFIHQHYDQNDTYNLKLLASAFHISRRGLTRLIKTAFEMTLHEYVVKIRMEKAMTELLSSRQTVKEVAARVGYADPFHFSRLFKKHHGIAPSEVKGPDFMVLNKSMDNRSRIA